MVFCSEKSGLTAQAMDQLWGASKASGGGRLGLTARLSERRHAGYLELARPACEHTHAISFLVSGSTHSELRLNDKIRFSQPRGQGTFQIARAGENLKVLLNDLRCRCLDLYLPDALLKGCFEQDFGKATSGIELLELGVERDAEITRIAKIVLAELESPDVAASMAIDAATLALCVVLIRRWSNHTKTALAPQRSLPAWKVRRVCDLLRSSLAENVALSELAASVGLSPYHFLRAFKAAVGVPPHGYQVQLRLHRARQLLETTDEPVTEIAARVGYSDPGYLARLFRKHFGTTPAAYRREWRA
jgi:AraC family transcriptional regulator